MLLRVILTAASVVALSAAANAADMYRPAAGGYKDVPYVGVNWSGLYVGVNGGYGANAASVPTGGLDPAGGFGGGQIGYNVQRGNIVFGLEADIEGADITELRWRRHVQNGLVRYRSRSRRLHRWSSSGLRHGRFRIRQRENYDRWRQPRGDADRLGRWRRR